MSNTSTTNRCEIVSIGDRSWLDSVSWTSNGGRGQILFGDVSSQNYSPPPRDNSRNFSRPSDDFSARFECFSCIAPTYFAHFSTFFLTSLYCMPEFEKVHPKIIHRENAHWEIVRPKNVYQKIVHRKNIYREIIRRNNVQRKNVHEKNNSHWQFCWLQWLCIPIHIVEYKRAVTNLATDSFLTVAPAFNFKSHHFQLLSVVLLFFFLFFRNSLVAVCLSRRFFSLEFVRSSLARIVWVCVVVCSWTTSSADEWELSCDLMEINVTNELRRHLKPIWNPMRQIPPN